MIDLQPRTSRLDFGTDPNPGLDPGWIFPFLQHEEDVSRHQIGYIRYTQKVVCS